MRLGSLQRCNHARLSASQHGGVLIKAPAENLHSCEIVPGAGRGGGSGVPF